MEEKKDKIEYNLIKLTPEELIEARLNKDKVEIDLMNVEGKLEIQKFKIKHDIAQLELKEDVEKIEDAIKKIKKSKEEIDKSGDRYNEKILCRDYDILCGEKRLELARFKIKKRMGSRISNEAIKTLENQIELHKHNLKVFTDQIRNKVRKERKIVKQIQLDEDTETDSNWIDKNTMIKLNEKQEKFLLLVSKDKKECIRTVGRAVYKTDVSAYTTRNKLLHLNLITLNKKKNKEIPSLTIKGKEMVEDIYSKRTVVSKK